MTIAEERADCKFRSIASALRQRGEALALVDSGVNSRVDSEEPNRWRTASRLCRRYVGVSLDELYDTRVERTPYGSCLHLVDRVAPFELGLAGPDLAEDTILSELRLVFGVGPVTAEAMRVAGVRRVSELVGHRRFGGSAAWLVQCWERQDLVSLHDHIRQRLGGAGHGLGLLLAGLVPPERVVVVDLETLGLWGAPIVLFGFARVERGCLEIHQYLARAGSEEPAALWLALKVLGGCDVMVTYNGRSADSPWMRQRLAYFGFGRASTPVHLDLLHPVRRRYRGGAGSGDPATGGSGPAASLLDCRLATVESNLLGIERSVDDLPGDAVPHFYREYERRQNVGPLIPIIDHNRADLVAVGRLLSHLGSDAAARW
ncbi:MAG: ribonuclease H-like domain-containing protein [Acidimicrobiales bacterium]